MSKPHKWAKEIKAWADGARVQSRPNDLCSSSDWTDDTFPSWATNREYRIKPEPRELWLVIYKDGCIDVRSNPIMPASNIDVVHVREVLDGH